MADVQNPTAPATIEWPTLFLVVGFWAGFLAVCLFAKSLPGIVIVIVLALLGGFYGSLQHEAIHRHPTPLTWLNDALVVLPLGVVQPYSRYKGTHLAHHESDLTNPIDDPESYYVTQRHWDRANGLKKAVLRANRTLLFRLSIGPALAIWGCWASDIRLARCDKRVARAWLTHLFATALVLVVIFVSAVPMWSFLIGFAYFGLAITMLRSFAEHCAMWASERTAMVETGWFFSVMFLNNNLHIAHHARPGVAWYRLPETSRQMGAVARAKNDDSYFRGYREIARRFGVKSFCQAAHPETTRAQ